MTPFPWPRQRGRLGLLLAGGLLVGACSATAGAQTAATGQAAASQTSTIQRGTVESTINATGAVKAVGDLSLSLQQGGLITAVLVKVGDRVTAGQPLIKADTRDLELAVQQAEANLASAQATYEQAKAGATQKEMEQAQAAVDQAQAKLQQTVQGTTTPQDIATAQAQLRSAQAKYQQTVQGTTTAQDIANGEAALRSAQAKLAATKAGTATDTDIASAEAGLRSAQSKLAQVQAGSAPADIASAQQKVQQAKDARTKQASQLSLSKEQARIAMEQAANDLRAAQEKYGAAKLIYDEIQRTGKDPTVTCSKGQPCNNKVTDAKLRQYKSDFESAQLAMSNAEQALQKSQLSYEDAKTQEIVGLRTADSQIQDAQAQLDKLTAPPDPQAVTQAQAAVDQAQASLDKLKAPAKETDVAQAQAAVDQAQASLDKLKAPANAQDVVQAKAAVDQAQANLAKLQAPANPQDVTQSQASLASVQATLNDLKAGPKAADLATALAGVKQAQVTRDLAKSKVDQATLTAPFAGVVAAVNAIPGQAATGSSSTSSSTTSSSTGLVTLVDDSTLSIDVNIAEADVAKVAAGQPARATFTALTGQTFPGKVAGIAPKSTVTSNVVSYVATVALDGAANVAVKTGMTATVTIVTASKQNVLVVPNRLVQTQGQQKTVTVEYKGERFAVPVQLGLVGDSTSEVVSGLQEGDVVASGAATTTTTGSGAGAGTPNQNRGGGGGEIGVPGAGGPPAGGAGH